MYFISNISIDMFIVLICRANQLISFYMMATLTIKELNVSEDGFFQNQ